MFSMSSLDQTPCRSGSPHGVRGALYSTALPPNAVITSGGGVLRAWPDSGAPADTMNATMPEAAPTDAIKRMVITITPREVDRLRFDGREIGRILRRCGRSRRIGST